MLYLNGKPVEVTMFPDKTSQVWKLPEEVLTGALEFNVRWKFDHEGEFMHLVQLKDLLDTQNVPTSLEIDYLPYARQDKRVNNSTTFALYSFARQLNRLKFDSVTLHDPHSAVALDLIEDSAAILPFSAISKALTEVEPGLICFPDEGASARYRDVGFFYARKSVAPGSSQHCPRISARKRRDQASGTILEYEVLGTVGSGGVLIVDDICDGGATFCLLAKALREKGATEVHLFVTHGIFSKGLKPLKDAGIDRIFTRQGEVSEVQGRIAYKEFA